MQSYRSLLQGTYSTISPAMHRFTPDVSSRLTTQFRNSFRPRSHTSNHQNRASSGYERGTVVSVNDILTCAARDMVI